MELGLEEMLKLIEQYSNEVNDEHSEMCELLARCARRDWTYLHGGEEVQNAILESVKQTYEYLTQELERVEEVQHEIVVRRTVYWETK